MTLYEHAGTARFVEPHVIESENGSRLRAANVIVCTGGASRQLPVPGFELTCTHSDAWRLESVPDSLLVIGAGATGVQVASIFNAFGSRVTLFEAAPRILMSEDEQVAAAMSTALQASGVRVLEHAGTIERFEPFPAGVRLAYSARDDTGTDRRDAGRGRGRLGREHRRARSRNRRGGDRPPRLHQGGLSAAHDRTGHLRRRRRHRAPHGRPRGRARGLPRRDRRNLGGTEVLPAEVSPLGSFTDPEYASVGLGEATARETYDVVVGEERFGSMPRPIIDGRPTGFCKLVVDREKHTILGCHIVGEQAIELAQLAALAVASGMKVERLALVPFSFPTYANALGRAAIRTARQLDPRPGGAGEGMARDAGVADGLDD